MFALVPIGMVPARHATLKPVAAPATPLCFNCTLAEGTLVEQQVRLQRAQQTERRYLAAAFTRVGELERRRAAGQAQVLGAFVRIYRTAVVPIQEIAGKQWLRGNGRRWAIAVHLALVLIQQTAVVPIQEVAGKQARGSAVAPGHGHLPRCCSLTAGTFAGQAMLVLLYPPTLCLQTSCRAC